MRVRTRVRAHRFLDVRGACVRRKKRSQPMPCKILDSVNDGTGRSYSPLFDFLYVAEFEFSICLLHNFSYVFLEVGFSASESAVEISREKSVKKNRNENLQNVV